jgi:DNA-binding NarL/FixJ family response regulator
VPGVLIVAADKAVREALRKLFQDRAKFAVCGEVESSTLALERAKSLSPSLIVLDAGEPLPKLLAQQLRQAAPDTPIFMLTPKYNVAVEKAALACGVTAVFSRTDDPETLIANALAVTEELAATQEQKDELGKQKSATARLGS